MYLLISIFTLRPLSLFFFFFLNDPPPTEIYTLPLHDALPISPPARKISGLHCCCHSDASAWDWGEHRRVQFDQRAPGPASTISTTVSAGADLGAVCNAGTRSEEHTSELQSQSNLVCRLLLEKK